jgi:hypothetical protein
MPYAAASLRESFRLFYPVGGGTFRILSQPISYQDYFLPKGTGIFFNNQTMSKVSSMIRGTLNG